MKKQEQNINTITSATTEDQPKDRSVLVWGIIIAVVAIVIVAIIFMGAN
jgi:choline-glycine betaine transporter